MLSGPFAKITYGNWIFTGPSLKWDLSFKSVPDDSGVTVKYNQYTLHFTCIVTDNDDMQTEGQAGFASKLVEIRQALNIPGADLTLENTGFDLSVNNPRNNSSTNYQDLNYGPLIEDVKVRPIGSSLVAEVECRIVFHIQNCNYNNGQIKEFATTNQYDTDNVTGLTTRTIEGMFSIVVSREYAVGGSLTKYSADIEKKFNEVVPAVPFGFRRLKSTRNISKDRSSISFTFIDEELPNKNPYPVGATNIEMTHKASAKPSGKSQIIGLVVHNRISGHVEVSKTTDLNNTWQVILQIARNRINKHPKDALVLLTELSITEKIFGPPRIDFEFGWTTTLGRNAGFANFAKDTGLFSDPGTDAQLWHDSQRENWHPLGQSRLQTDISNENITDLCSRHYLTDDNATIKPVSEGGGSLSSTCPFGEYLTWRAIIEVEIDNKTYTVDVVADQDATEFDSKLGIPEIVEDEDGSVLATTYRKSKQVDVIGDSPDITIRLRGYAIRLKDTPEVPKIAMDKFNTEAKSAFNKGTRNGVSANYTKSVLPNLEIIRTNFLANINGCTLWATYWDITYKANLPNSGDLRELIGIVKKSIVSTRTDPDGNRIGKEES